MIQQSGSGRTAEYAVFMSEEVAQYGTDRGRATPEEYPPPVEDSAVIVPPTSIHVADDTIQEI